MANPRATVEITASSRKLGRGLKEARDEFSEFGRGIRRSIAGESLMSKAGGSAVGNMVASGAQAVGGFLVDQFKETLAFEDALTRLGITARKSPEYMRAFGNSVRQTSSATGVAASEILGGASAYVALTGDMDGASTAASQWARVAQATGSTVSDVAQSAAALKQNLKIDPADMEAAFSALAVQGKEGAIELRDLSQELAQIAPQWANFEGGSGLQGLKELGAAMQIVKRGFGGDAGETTTGLQSFLNSVRQHARQLKGAGVEVFTTDEKGNKRLKNVLEIVDAIGDSKLMKNPTALGKALGRVEALRAFEQLHENRKELEQLVETASDANVINRDLGTYLDSAAGRQKVAWQQAKNEIAAAFTPERIELFTKAVTGAVSALAKVVSAIGAVLDGAKKVGEMAANDLRENGSESTLGTLTKLGGGGATTAAGLDMFKNGGALDPDEIQKRQDDAAVEAARRRQLKLANGGSGFVGSAGIDTYAGRAVAEAKLGAINAQRRAANEAERSRPVNVLTRSIDRLATKLDKITATTVEVAGDVVVKAGRTAGNAARSRPAN